MASLSSFYTDTSSLDIKLYGDTGLEHVHEYNEYPLDIPALKPGDKIIYLRYLEIHGKIAVHEVTKNNMSGIWTKDTHNPEKDKLMEDLRYFTTLEYAHGKYPEKFV